jgi:hypothetical protein
MMKLCACIDNRDSKNDRTNDDEYLSHPIEQTKHSLLQHSIDVAMKAGQLLSDKSVEVFSSSSFVLVYE